MTKEIKIDWKVGLKGNIAFQKAMYTILTKKRCNNCEVIIDEEDWICKKCEENIRTCAKCWDAMSEGYIYWGDTYCSWGCLPISEKQFEAEYTEDWDNCYTAWESIYYD